MAQMRLIGVRTRASEVRHEIRYFHCAGYHSTGFWGIVIPRTYPPGYRRAIICSYRGHLRSLTRDGAQAVAILIRGEPDSW